jgi:hypothetical protein
VQEILSLVAEKAAAIRAAEQTRLPPTASVAIRSEMIAAPESVAVIAEALERTGDSTRTQAGVPKGRRRTGRFSAIRMPVFERFRPTLSVQPPTAYTLAPSDTQVVRLLQQHGITVEKTSDGRTMSVEEFVVDSANAAVRPFQGHHEMRLAGHWKNDTRTVPPGSYLVRLNQPLRQLVPYLLEPQSDDGLVTWNFFDSSLKPGAAYPVLRVMTDSRPDSR